MFRFALQACGGQISSWVATQWSSPRATVQVNHRHEAHPQAASWASRAKTRQFDEETLDCRRETSDCTRATLADTRGTWAGTRATWAQTSLSLPLAGALTTGTPQPRARLPQPLQTMEAVAPAQPKRAMELELRPTRELEAEESTEAEPLLEEAVTTQGLRRLTSRSNGEQQQPPRGHIARV